MNYLTKRKVSIVSNIPGTTRDVVESTLDIGGYPVILSDTAGLRPSDSVINDANVDAPWGISPIEKIGIELAHHRIRNETDFRICVLDSSQDLYAQLHKVGELIDKKSLLVLNKVDLVSESTLDAQKRILSKLSPYVACTSMQTHDGSNELLQLMIQLLKDKFEVRLDDKNPVITSLRQKNHLLTCINHLDQFLIQNDVVLAAEELRLALISIGMITKNIDLEMVLDTLFKDFCIGK
jgi:tRNA modification GTPase